MRVVSDEACVGDGITYTYSVELPEGTVPQAQWFRIDLGTEAREVIRAIEETLDADMTNTAEYTFGTRGGDNKQDDTQAATIRASGASRFSYGPPLPV